jgi:peptidoglycan/LPS O-acetylase OafA/YrhL
VPDAVAPPPGNPRFPLFDALRAIAALSILLTHVSLFSGANEAAWWGGITARLDVGVTVFFVVSGFLLYRPFVAARLIGSPRPRVRDYARRRVLRIVPAYWVALTLLAIYPGLHGVFSHDWWRYYGFVQIYDRYAIIGGIGQAFSLAIEASFYVVLPVYALAIARLTRGQSARRTARLELAGFGVLALAVLVAREYTRTHLEGSTLHSTLAGTADWFAIGMALALASVLVSTAEREPRAVRLVARRPELCWGAAAAVLVLLGYGLGLPRGIASVNGAQLVAEHVLYGAFAALLVLPAVFGDRAGGLPRRVLAWRPLAWLGLISYGIFLWHLRLLDWLAEKGAGSLIPGSVFLSLLVSTVALTVPIAAASYYAVERPILRFKDPGARRRRISASQATAASTTRATSAGMRKRVIP